MTHGGPPTALAVTDKDLAPLVPADATDDDRTFFNAEAGDVVALTRVGGLHHRYSRAA